MRFANEILFVLRYIMHVQIYFRMHEVRVARDITSLSHQENTEDISNRRFELDVSVARMHLRILMCLALKFRRFQSRWKEILTLGILVLHYSLTINYDCSRKLPLHTGKARVTVTNWPTSTGGRKSTSFCGNRTYV